MVVAVGGAQALRALLEQRLSLGEPAEVVEAASQGRPGPGHAPVVSRM